MSTPLEQEPIPDDADDQEEDEGKQWFQASWGRLAAFGILILGSLVYLFVGSIPAISYSYNPFSGMTSRDVDGRSFVAIWSEQVRSLPTASMQWVVDGLFVASVAVVILGVIGGAWLLLVSSEREATDDVATRVHRYRRR